MFNKLSDKLQDVFSSLKAKGVLKEEDVTKALREIRIALLEADVALPVAKDFVKSVKEKAIGQNLIKGINPSQQVIKLVNDELIKKLGEKSEGLNLNVAPPAIVLMVGLQGSGKTTTSAKLANLLKKDKKVLLASLDIYRPAAQKQLEILAEQIGVNSLEIVEGQKPEDIAKRAIKEAKNTACDVLILDTAGRLSIDAAMMSEIKSIHKVANPAETLLVLDAMTGQDAINTAKNFNEAVGITGTV
ncbi:MAG: signal recognition particle receptor subunit alpha, partial [Alphaproteobacteria bacterium]|nr:signal recognition particle receptor subunit alpha [Alphaproteobacteria bacterium]